MANIIVIPRFCFFYLFALIFLHSAVAQNPPTNSPALPPEAPESTPPPMPLVSPSAPVESPSVIPPISTNSPLSSTASPPAPPPVDLPPSSHSPPTHSPSPPAHPPASDVNDINATDGEDQSKDGLSGGKKAGIAFGVIGAACLVGFGGMLYKKRKDNERRARYGYTARSDFL